MRTCEIAAKACLAPCPGAAALPGAIITKSAPASGAHDWVPLTEIRKSKRMCTNVYAGSTPNICSRPPLTHYLQSSSNQPGDTAQHFVDIPQYTFVFSTAVMGQRLDKGAVRQGISSIHSGDNGYGRLRRDSGGCG